MPRGVDTERLLQAVYRGYMAIDLPVCPDKIVSGSWVESLSGYTEAVQQLYGLVDTFLLYTGHETL